MIITHGLPVLVISFYFYFLTEGTDSMKSRAWFLCNMVVVVWKKLLLSQATCTVVG